ncbi:MAG: hypothetical protein AB7G06_02320 [Bdellovibrionales bacterium]
MSRAQTTAPKGWQPKIVWSAEAQKDIGRLLWGKEFGGVADRRLPAVLHTIAGSFRNADLRKKRASRITNTTPRGSLHIVFPKNLKTITAEGTVDFITPCAGEREKVHPMRDNWQATLAPEYAYRFAEYAKAYAEATTDTERAKWRQLFTAQLLDINMYPNATGLDDQNKARAKSDPLTEPTAAGSHAWMEFMSDRSDPDMMYMVGKRLQGIKHVTAIIGDEDSPERESFLQWYIPELKKSINNKAEDHPVDDDQAHDIGAIICSSLAAGGLTMLPRRVPPNERSYLMRLGGYLRCYTESLPKNTREIRKTEHYKFGGRQMMKVVTEVHDTYIEIIAVRPLESNFIGANLAEAQANPFILEITGEGERTKEQLDPIFINGSEVGKNLLGWVPAWLTGIGAWQQRTRTDALPKTARVDLKVIAPKG